MNISAYRAMHPHEHHTATLLFFAPPPTLTQTKQCAETTFFGLYHYSTKKVHPKTTSNAGLSSNPKLDLAEL